MKTERARPWSRPLDIDAGWFRRIGLLGVEVDALEIYGSQAL